MTEKGEGGEGGAVGGREERERERAKLWNTDLGEGVDPTLEKEEGFQFQT